jgi:hypothetical protein
VGVWGGGSPPEPNEAQTNPESPLGPQGYTGQFRRTPRGRQPAVIDESTCQPGVNSGPSAGHQLRPDDSCRLNDSGESLVRVFLRATKVAEGHARESGVTPRPWKPSPPQRLVGSPQAVSKLHGARRSAVASIKAEADRRAANVLPIIREVQKAGATTLRQIAEALNARGVATARGGQ